ncbi:MAG: thioesterase domain-containing protein, partial [Pseudomonadota bacterium]
IRGLSQRISQQIKTTHIHHLKHSSEAATLVFAHPASGLCFPYFAMQKHINDINFYGVSNDRFGDRGNPYLSLEDMAASYASDVNSIVKSGPIILGGFCTGGAVAYEMAQRLKAIGRDVRGLILIDAYKLDRGWTQTERQTALTNLLRNLNVDSKSVLAQRIGFEIEQNTNLVASYQPKVNLTPTLIISAETASANEFSGDLRRMSLELNGWRGLIPDDMVTTSTIDAAHKEMMSHDHHVQRISAAVLNFVRATKSEPNHVRDH